MRQNRRHFLSALALASLGGLGVRGVENITTGEAFDAGSKLEKIRAQHGIPALAGAVADSTRMLAAGASGLRCIGQTDKVKVKDQFHFGSLTKSMTATLAARMVERKKVRWNTTIWEALKGLSENIHPFYREVTLEQLLSHRGGVPSQPPADLWEEAWRKKASRRQQRTIFVRGILKVAPTSLPGTEFIYSNQGYAIAGAMLEEITGLPWETMLENEVFEKLQMKTAGFGFPGVSEEIQEPWGHVLDGKDFRPVQSDNPPAIGPAGTVHGSVLDLVRYGALHLRGERGLKTDYLEQSSWKKLHTPPSGQIYAMGWERKEAAWTRGPSLWHNGSNNLFYAVLWIAPARNLAVGAVSNAATEDAKQACEEAASTLAGMV